MLNLIVVYFCVDSDPSFFSSQAAQPSGKPKMHNIALAFGSSLGCLCLIVLGFGFVLWWRHRRNKQKFFDVKGLLSKIICHYHKKHVDVEETMWSFPLKLTQFVMKFQTNTTETFLLET